jgi:C-terminal processing protease CtpA/Prc
MNRLPRVLCRFVFILFLVSIVLVPAQARQHKLQPYTIEKVQQMLKDGYNEVRKNYYDKEYHGVDWDARYHQAQETVTQINSLGQGLSLVASLMMTLNDSHTFFIPPSRPLRTEYGFRMIMIGERAFISRVRPGTDAESKVHPGDEIITYNRYKVDRPSFWKLNYYVESLAPNPATALVLKSPEGQQREENVVAKTHELKRVMDLTLADGGLDIFQMIRDNEASYHIVRHRSYELGDVMIWKVPQFDLDETGINHWFGIARKHKTLILDLRENPGGYVFTLEHMLGLLFDHDVKIADRVGRRKDLKPQIAKSRGKDIFSGRVIVLVDSGSGSAAELFARVIQLEKRGTVIGDRTSGKVMESKRYGEMQGADTQIFYGFSVTDANLIMAGGKSLENVGVVPDEIVLPTGKDLAEGKDPVLARAVELAA